MALEVQHTPDGRGVVFMHDRVWDGDEMLGAAERLFRDPSFPRLGYVIADRSRSRSSSRARTTPEGLPP